jgi:hypothetical protein
MELRSLLGWNVHTAEAINAQAWAKGPALVTTVYLALYYVLLFSQSFTKLYLFQQAKAKQDDAPSLSSIKYFSQVWYWAPAAVDVFLLALVLT